MGAAAIVFAVEFVTAKTKKAAAMLQKAKAKVIGAVKPPIDELMGWDL